MKKSLVHQLLSIWVLVSFLFSSVGATSLQPPQAGGYSIIPDFAETGIRDKQAIADPNTTTETTNGDNLNDRQELWGECPVKVCGEFAIGESGIGVSGWISPTNISNDEVVSVHGSVASDPLGNVHVVWANSSTTEICDSFITTPCYIYYATKPVGGTWSMPESLSPNNEVAQDVDIAVDPSGAVHVVWDSKSLIPGEPYSGYYITKPLGEDWSQRETIISPQYTRLTPEFDVDTNGNLHLLYNSQCSSGCQRTSTYTMKPPGSSWSSPESVSDISPDYSVYFYSQIAADACGGVHVTFQKENDPIFYYRMRSAGIWSSPTPFTGLDDGGNLITDANCTVHLSFTRDQGGGQLSALYVTKPNAGSWSAEETVPGFPPLRFAPQAVDLQSGIIHWMGHEEPEGDIWYRSRTIGGKWSEPVKVSNSGLTLDPRSTMDGLGRLHAVWWDNFTGWDSPMGDVEIFSASWIPTTVEYTIFLPVVTKPQQ